MGVWGTVLRWRVSARRTWRAPASVADDHHHQDVAGDPHHLLRQDRVNRCIVVTGASKGIGLASAEILNARGWSVIGIARHQPHAFPGIFITVDLADPEATRRLGEDIAARTDVLGIVNNVRVAHHETSA